VPLAGSLASFRGGFAVTNYFNPLFVSLLEREWDCGIVLVVQFSFLSPSAKPKMQFYSDPSRTNDPHALPDCEVFQLTATEVASGMEDEIHEYLKRPTYRLATMNSKAREQLLDAMVEDLEIKGGWFYWFCFPGSLPDSEPMGPFDTKDEAISDARQS
jgi:hypothetical protein